jgi:hypothetical protein
MKGLADVLGMKPKGPVVPEEEVAAEVSEEGGSKTKFARLAAEAIANKEFDTAADALVSLVEACKGYSAKE